jgi:hypothetical protein
MVLPALAAEALRLERVHVAFVVLEGCLKAFHRFVAKHGISTEDPGSRDTSWEAESKDKVA